MALPEERVSNTIAPEASKPIYPGGRPHICAPIHRLVIRIRKWTHHNEEHPATPWRILPSCPTISPPNLRALPLSIRHPATAPTATRLAMDRCPASVRSDLENWSGPRCPNLVHEGIHGGTSRHSSPTSRLLTTPSPRPGMVGLRPDILCWIPAFAGMSGSIAEAEPWAPISPDAC